MTEDEIEIIYSPLNQEVTRDGKTVEVIVYGDGEDGWLLEVQDEYGNSTVWESPFPTDQAAFDEVFRTMDDEGIDSLIGKPSRNAAEIDQALSDDEFNELDDFLADGVIEETSMDVSTLEGFLTALAIGPRAVLPSAWLQWVWDMEEGEAAPEFERQEQATRIMSLILRHYNTLLGIFQTNPAAFDPVFRRGDQWGASEWCEGFILGFQFNDEAWSLLAVGQPKWFTPFFRLGTDEGIEFTEEEGDGERWMNEIESSLVKLYTYWKDKRGRNPAEAIGEYRPRQKEIVQIVRGGPKIGRNDLCPCGSGLKFKKCCGASGAPPTLH